MLSEISQRQILYGITYIWNLKNSRNECMYKIETDSQTENKLVVTNKIVTKQTGEREGQIRGIGITNAAAAAAKSLQSCPTLCDPLDGSPPSSPVPGILQARTLEWVAISLSNA